MRRGKSVFMWRVTLGLTRKIMEPTRRGATGTESPKGVFAEKKHHKLRLSLKNNTARVLVCSECSGGPSDIEGKTTRVGASECGQRTSFNRISEAGNRDDVEGVVANTPNLFRNGAVGFIDWLDRTKSFYLWFASRHDMPSRAAFLKHKRMCADYRAGEDMGLQTTRLAHDVDGSDWFVSPVRHEPHDFFEVLPWKRGPGINPGVRKVPPIPVFRACCQN
jgi:hypothetical protein